MNDGSTRRSRPVFEDHRADQLFDDAVRRAAERRREFANNGASLHNGRLFFEGFMTGLAQALAVVLVIVVVYTVVVVLFT